VASPEILKEWGGRQCISHLRHSSQMHTTNYVFIRKRAAF